LFTILIVLLVLVLVGAFPVFPHNRDWGYMPFSGILGFVLLVVLLLYLTGNLHRF
jgi:Protein of unknown function (DUF3309)